MMYLDVWRSGTFFWTQETPLRLSDVERSVILRPIFAIGSAFAYLLFFHECATPPHVQAFPRISNASDKRWGEKTWVWGYLQLTRQ